MKPSLGLMIALLSPSLLAPPALLAQATYPHSADVESPEALVTAAYDALARAPGEPFQWDRFRSLFLPQARLVPNTEQTGGEFRVLSPEQFIDWIDSFWEGEVGIGSAADQGFEEREVASQMDRYGDVAHVFSTYEKHYWNSTDVLGRGINSFQLVRNGGRWWIAGIVWDEEPAGGPIPGRYRGPAAAGGAAAASPGEPAAVAGEEAAVRAAVELYLESHATGSGAPVGRLFHPDAMLYWVQDGQLSARTGEAYVGGFRGEPPPDEAERRRWIEAVDVTGDVAVAKVVLDYPGALFTDYFALLRLGGEWRVMTKIFHADRRPRGQRAEAAVGAN